MDYPIRLPDQLGEHIRSLRKTRGLTQIELGRKIGVGQARMGEIERNAGSVSLDQLLVVLSALVRRLTPPEAKDLIAQLPLRIGDRLRALPPGPDKEITEEGILTGLAGRLGVTSDRAREVLEAAVRTLDANVTAGQMEDVRHQLPKELRSVFAPA